MIHIHNNRVVLSSVELAKLTFSYLLTRLLTAVEIIGTKYMVVTFKISLLPDHGLDNS